MLPDFLSGKNGAEGYNVGQRLGIGAAADGFWLTLQPGLLPVDPQQGGDKGAVLGDVQLGLVDFGVQSKSGACKSAVQNGGAVGVAFGDRVTVVDFQRQPVFIAVNHAEIQGQTAGNRIMEGDSDGSAVGLHAEGRRQKMYRVGNFLAQGQGVQRQQQTADGIFPQLRGAAMGAFALGLHEKAVIRDSKPHLWRGETRQSLRQFPGTGQLGAGVRRNHVWGGSTVNGQEPNVAGLDIGVGKGHVDNALFPVDHRVFAVRGEAHDGYLTAVCKIVLDIVGTGFFVAAEENPDAAADGKAGIPQSGQGIQGSNGGAFVVRGASAPDFSIPQLAAEGGAAPAVPGGNHVQMSQNGDHFVALTVFTPAQMAVHIFRPEAQLPGGVQHMDKAIPDGCPVGCAVLRVALNAGNPDILPKSGKKLGLQRVNASTQFHRNSSNHTISR